jgi:transposase-like protein
MAICPHCKSNTVQNPEYTDVCDDCDKELHEEYMNSVASDDFYDRYDFPDLHFEISS